ncbi:RND transporter [Pedobacter quisquiliarum]|uniref:RND transporter n=2 Tax=Pedobacter quisquiliarum TaxID=1834438 RepID=A0A916U5S0_9SPHI|nr:RND transporter [Pedobacter quisquiliarum]
MFLLLGCAEEQGETSASTAAAAKTYTCPMHPQVLQDKQGTCPVCGMDLVLFEKSAAVEGLQLNDRQRALANISTMAIETGAETSVRQLNGRLVANPAQTTFITSRVAGRIDRLYVRQTGEPVSKGQPLYQIYSEDLVTLQQEFLLATEQAAQFPEDKTFAQLLLAARQKLILYGQSAGQIRLLQQKRKANPNITIFAAETGTVAELSVTEGQYVAEGSPLLKLESYNSLWVEADIYASELGNIKAGQQLRVQIPGWEDQPQRVKVSFINPALQSGSQLLQIRAEMPNPGGIWQPGLQAKVFVESKTDAKSIVLPADAVLKNAAGAHVWLERKQGYYEPRVVQAGAERAQGVEIISGLNPGDRVVVSGAYLLYSEYVLKKGKDPMTTAKKG